MAQPLPKKTGPRCTTCKGRGTVRDATSAKSSEKKLCPSCDGSGRIT